MGAIGFMRRKGLFYDFRKILENFPKCDNLFLLAKNKRSYEILPNNSPTYSVGGGGDELRYALRNTLLNFNQKVVILLTFLKVAYTKKIIYQQRYFLLSF